MKIVAITLIIGVVIISGCVGQMGGLGNKTFNVYISALPSYAPSGYENTVNDAFSYWEQRENMRFNEVDNLSKSNVLVDWIKEFGGITAGHVVRGDYVQIGIGDRVLFKRRMMDKY